MKNIKLLKRLEPFKKYIIGICAVCVIIGVILINSYNYTNMCKKIMSENKEVVSQLDILDSNSTEWDNLFTKTENENPQLIECIYPSDNNN